MMNIFPFSSYFNMRKYDFNMQRNIKLKSWYSAITQTLSMVPVMEDAFSKFPNSCLSYGTQQARKSKTKNSGVQRALVIHVPWGQRPGISSWPPFYLACV